MDTDDNLWCIKLPNGDVRSGTLEQLDEAFQAGHIDENTLVLGEGSPDWVRLGELLGLEDPPPAASAPPIQPVPVPTQSAQPPCPQRAVPPAQPGELAPASIPAPPLPARIVPQPFARASVSAAPQTTGSLSPMTTAVDDGIPVEFRSGSRAKRVVGFGVVIAAAFGAAGFVAVRSGRLHFEAPSTPTVAAVPVYVAPPPEPVPPPPVATQEVTAAPQDSAPPRLSELQKQQLQTADKAREKSKVQKATSAPRPATRSKSTGFTTGGNKFDPLNASF